MAAPKLPKRLSLSDVESSSERVMPGTYHARVSEMEPKLNKAGDGYYFNADLVIISEGPAKNRHVWEILPLKQAALWKLKGFLVACGVDPDADIDTEEIPELCKGEVVDIVVGEEEYNGEMRPIIRRVKPSTMPTLEDLADEAEEEAEDEDEDEAEEGEWDLESLSDLSLKELREVAKEAEVYEKGMSKDDLIAAILGEDEDEDEDDEEDEDEDPFADDEDEEEEPAPKKRKVARK